MFHTTRICSHPVTNITFFHASTYDTSHYTLPSRKNKRLLLQACASFFGAPDSNCAARIVSQLCAMVFPPMCKLRYAHLRNDKLWKSDFFGYVTSTCMSRTSVLAEPYRLGKESNYLEDMIALNVRASAARICEDTGCKSSWKASFLFCFSVKTAAKTSN